MNPDDLKIVRSHPSQSQVRIGIVDHDGNKGSCAAYVIWFTNALNQRRRIAFDGQRWFVQANSRARYKPVSAGWVPERVKEEMSAWCPAARS